jgi:2-polyprenyl-6-hydroxyphenyl methylase/3-demethylubiquinone-9 3-methyltransferase
MASEEYYSDHLSGQRLKQCYDLASERVLQYLAAETNFVKNYLQPGMRVLELGCGYGRALAELIPTNAKLFGLDIALANLQYCRVSLSQLDSCHLFQMSAAVTGFQSNSFDIVFCIQNGLSAFKMPPNKLILETMRLVKPGGTALFSSYSQNFWDYRLDWFIRQSRAGLVGAIDYNKTKNGIIHCKDGFTATTFSEADFTDLCSDMFLLCKTHEIDNSSIFCEVTKA